MVLKGRVAMRHSDTLDQGVLQHQATSSSARLLEMACETFLLALPEKLFGAALLGGEMWSKVVTRLLRRRLREVRRGRPPTLPTRRPLTRLKCRSLVVAC